MNNFSFTNFKTSLIPISVLYDYHRFLIQFKPFSHNHAEIKESSSKIADSLFKRLSELLNKGEENEEEAQLLFAILSISLSKELFNSEKRNLAEKFTKTKNQSSTCLLELDIDISDYFKQLQKHPSYLKVGLGLCDLEGNLGIYNSLYVYINIFF